MSPILTPKDMPPPGERPDCPRCGCNAYRVTDRAQRWGHEVEDRDCQHCGHRWSSGAAAPAPDPDDAGHRGCVWTLPRCPTCGSHRVPTTKTVQSDPPVVHWRKCQDCGAAFKSVGE